MKKVINLICVVLAFICFGIGAVGVVLPILPTTPFLLLAGILFAKGSERFHKWFLSTKLYRNHISDFVATKSMTKRAKAKVLVMISVLFTIATFICPVWQGRVVIVAVWAFHFYFFLFRIRNKTEGEPQTDAAENAETV